MKLFKINSREYLRLLIDILIYTESFIHKKSRSTTGKKRILIMRKDGLGDCIIFYPTLKAYRDYYSDAEITLIFPTYFKDLAPLLSHDLVDHIIWFDHKAFGSQFLYRRKFLLDLKRAGYDTFIYPVFSRETIGFLMMKLAGAPERIGFDGDISEQGKKAEATGSLVYTRLIQPPEHMVQELARDVYFAEHVTGKKITVSFPTIDVRKLSDARAIKILEEQGLLHNTQQYAIIFPGAGVAYRIWPAHNVAHIVDYLAHKHIRSIICGGPKEKELVADVISKVTTSLQPINLAGKTDLGTLAHLLSKATLYFGSDTGILHLAVAVGTPAVAIVGMGGLDRFFPYGDPKKNRAVRDTTRPWHTGNWSDAHLLAPGEIHPSIKNITVTQAQKEIDFVLE